MNKTPILQPNIIEAFAALTEEAESLGFVWPNREAIYQQIASEIEEIEEAIKNNEPLERIQEEIGDLLHAAIDLCLFLKFDLPTTLSKTHAKFSQRLEALENLINQRGLKNLEGQSCEFMLDLWHEAKAQTYSKAKYE